MNHWKHDLSVAVVLFAVAASFYLGGLGNKDPAFLFPSYLSPILAGLSVLLCLSALRRRKAEGALIHWPNVRGPALLILITGGFILILPYIGFIPAGTLFSSALFLSLGYPRRGLAIVIGLLSSLSIYLVFHSALGVALPLGSLWLGE